MVVVAGLCLEGCGPCRFARQLQQLLPSASADRAPAVTKTMLRTLQAVLALHDAHALEFSACMLPFLNQYTEALLNYNPAQQVFDNRFPRLGHGCHNRSLQ